MRITKVLSLLAATAIVFATTAALSSSAKPVYTRNNTGNNTEYDSKADLSLLNYTINGDMWGKVKSSHMIDYDGWGNAKCIPNNYVKEKNTVYWYSEYKKKGKIQDYYENTTRVKNGKTVKYELAEGMKHWYTFDDDVTYFRYDIWPSDGYASTDKEAEAEYRRRASTDVYDD